MQKLIAEIMNLQINEIDPIQTDTTDSKYLFNNSDAIVVNLKKKKQ